VRAGMPAIAKADEERAAGKSDGGGSSGIRCRRSLLGSGQAVTL
jgi:hypothetical protein